VSQFRLSQEAVSTRHLYASVTCLLTLICRNGLKKLTNGAEHTVTDVDKLKKCKYCRRSLSARWICQLPSGVYAKLGSHSDEDLAPLDFNLTPATGAAITRF